MKGRLMGWIALSAALLACAKGEPDRTRAVATESAAGAAAPAESAAATTATARVDTSASDMAGMQMSPKSTGAAHGGAMPGMPAMEHGGMRGMPAMEHGGMRGTPAMEHGGMRGTPATRAMLGMPGMPGMETGRDPGREKLDRLVALLLRDPVVLRRIEADTLLHARWNEVARRTLSSPE